MAWRDGIEGVRGSHFPPSRARRPEAAWGLLGKGALLLASSYPNRTSPLLRGEYVMRNLIGVPPAEWQTNLDSVAPEVSLTGTRAALAPQREPELQRLSWAHGPAGDSRSRISTSPARGGTWIEIGQAGSDRLRVVARRLQDRGSQQLREALLA